jgi:penicillin-binding protein 1A
VEGPWITEVAGAAGSAEGSGVALAPELLTGVGDTGLERRRPVALGDMSPFLPLAVLAAEDHRFFDHPGLDAVAVARALVANVSRGGITQGARTLTQQLV